MYLTMFTVLLAAVVGHTDCHLSNTEEAVKLMSIELINPKPLHTINALSTPCLEPYHSLYCLNGGQCFNVSLCPAYIVSCECATGFWGERCEWKYLDQSYNPKHYIELDDISASQNRSEVDESGKSDDSINILVTEMSEIYAGSSAVNGASDIIILLLAMLSLHFLMFIVAA